jgi:hypothetical protein
LKALYKHKDFVNKDWDYFCAQAPGTDNVQDYIQLRSMIVPFPHIFTNIEDVLYVPTVNPPLYVPCLELEAVRAGECVTWTGRGIKMTEPARVIIGGTAIINPDEQTKLAAPEIRKRKRLEGGENSIKEKLKDILQPGSIIYIALRSWDIYNEISWPYPFRFSDSFEKCFFKAQCGNFQTEKEKKIDIKFEAFDDSFFVNLIWVKKWGRVKQLPEGAILIDQILYDKYERDT